MSEEGVERKRIGCLPSLLIIFVVLIVVVGVTGYFDERRLNDLKNSDPETYLAEIKSRNEARYWDELKLLDPDRYEKDTSYIRTEIINEGRERALNYAGSFYGGLIDANDTAIRRQQTAPRDRALLAQRNAELNRKLEVAISVIPRGDFDELIEIGVALTALNYCSSEAGYPAINGEKARVSIADIQSEYKAYSRRIGAEGLGETVLTGSTDVTSGDPLGMNGEEKKGNCDRYLPFVLTSEQAKKLM